jgi:hypothetical protein
MGETVSTVADPPALPLNTWSHLTATYDGAFLRLYVNGELVDTDDAPSVIAGEGELQIGGDEDWSAAGFFDGRIDEVRVYDRALDGGEIAADKAAPIQTPRTAPIAAYSFDEGEGEVAEDSAGEHDGALEHTEWVKGKYGSAIYLDGNNDFVSIADAPDLDLSEEFTLEAWVRPDSAQTDAPVIEKRTSNFYSYKLLAGGETAGVPEGFVADAPFSWEEVADEEALTNKAWSHLAMTYDGAAIRLYVNGKLVDTNSAPGPQGSEGNLIIGGEETEDFFKGRIDEVRIYDRALNGSEAADITRPTFNGHLIAIPITENGQTTVWFSEASDAASPLGKAPYYTYRYALNSGPYTAWETTSHNYFDVATPEEEETISFEVYASDAAGNRSPTQSESVSALPLGEAAEYDEEQIKEAEELEQIDRNISVIDNPYRTSSSGGGAQRIPRVPPNKCTTGAPDPHISTHAKHEGHTRINAVGFVVCGLPGVTGYLSNQLRRAGPYGTYPVSSSGNVAIKSPAPQEKVQSIINEFDCTPGTYINVVISRVVAPPPVKFRDPFTIVASDTKTIDRC